MIAFEIFQAGHEIRVVIRPPIHRDMSPVYNFGTGRPIGPTEYRPGDVLLNRIIFVQRRSIPRPTRLLLYRIPRRISPELYRCRQIITL